MLSSVDYEKRQPDKRPTFRGEFSFVNKDAGNIGSMDHSTAVSWHVRHRYDKWKKASRNWKLKNPVRTFSASAPGPLLSQAPKRPGGNRRFNGPQPFTSHTNSPTGLDLKTTSQQCQRDDPLVPPQHQPAAIRPALFTTTEATQFYRTENNFPFSSSLCEIQTEPGIHNMEHSGLSLTSACRSILSELAYYYLIPQMWPEDGRDSLFRHEKAKMLEDLAAINEDNCYARAYLCFLAMCRADMNNDDDLLLRARLLQVQVMAEIRLLVALPGLPDMPTLKAILKLFCSETIMDNTSVARAHLKMLRKVVDQNGGITVLDSWFREDLLSCDTYFALKYQTRPLFPASEWTPGPLSQPWSSRLISAGIITNSHKLRLSPLIDHPAINLIIASLQELFQVQEYLSKYEVAVDDHLLRWQQLRRYDCVSRIADLNVDALLYPHLFLRPKMLECFCIALALMANMVLGSAESVRLGLTLLDRLRKELSNAESGDAKDETRKFRFWALYVGSLAEKVHPVSVELRQWFSIRFETMARNLQATSWNDAQDILKRFLYTEQLHQEINGTTVYRIVDFRSGLYSASGCSWRVPDSTTSGEGHQLSLANIA